MNKVFISGKIHRSPFLRTEPNNVPHLILTLRVQHKTAAGLVHKELNRVSAWHNVALWGAEHLQQGQFVSIQGYLTQRKGNAEKAQLPSTEITADEFLLGSFHEANLLELHAALSKEVH